MAETQPDRKQYLPQEEEDLTQFADVALSGYALLRLDRRIRNLPDPARANRGG